jgi:hypothetical protein
LATQGKEQKTTYNFLKENQWINGILKNYSLLGKFNFKEGITFNDNCERNAAIQIGNGIRVYREEKVETFEHKIWIHSWCRWVEWRMMNHFWMFSHALVSGFKMSSDWLPCPSV